MKVSDIKLYEVIDKVESFNPVKVTFNNRVIYNDYGSTTEVTPGIYGELLPFFMVAPDRIESFKNSIVKSIRVEIVDYHHSVVKIRGKYYEHK